MIAVLSPPGVYDLDLAVVSFHWKRKVTNKITFTYLPQQRLWVLSQSRCNVEISIHLLDKTNLL
jgi:hypothetical protein